LRNALPDIYWPSIQVLVPCNRGKVSVQTLGDVSLLSADLPLSQKGSETVRLKIYPERLNRGGVLSGLEKQTIQIQDSRSYDLGRHKKLQFDNELVN
jgi:hypothetical protein